MCAVFYELLGGVNPTLKKKWRLKNARNYRYLTMSSEIEVCGLEIIVNQEVGIRVVSIVLASYHTMHRHTMPCRRMVWSECAVCNAAVTVD